MFCALMLVCSFRNFFGVRGKRKTPASAILLQGQERLNSCGATQLDTIIVPTHAYHNTPACVNGKPRPSPLLGRPVLSVCPRESIHPERRRRLSTAGGSLDSPLSGTTTLVQRFWGILPHGISYVNLFFMLTNQHLSLILLFIAAAGDRPVEVFHALASSQQS